MRRIGWGRLVRERWGLIKVVNEVLDWDKVRSWVYQSGDERDLG